MTELLQVACVAVLFIVAGLATMACLGLLIVFMFGGFNDD